MSEFANAVGLLTLTIGANFTGDLFGCGVKQQLTNNPIVKHCMAFLLLLFFIVLTNKDAFLKNATANSWVTMNLLSSTLLVYLGFIAFTKCTFEISILVIAVLIFILFMDIEKNNKDDKIKADIDNYKYIAMTIGLGALAYGVFSYYQKQSLEHGNDFTLYKFFLGTTKCAWEK
jgi:hypothetical protein